MSPRNLDLGTTLHEQVQSILPRNSVLTIGVAPITQDTHVRNKNSNIQGRSLNVIKVIFHTIRTAHKGKNSFPLGANSFVKGCN